MKCAGKDIIAEMERPGVVINPEGSYGGRRLSIAGRAAAEFERDLLRQGGQEGILLKGKIQAASSPVPFPVVSRVFF